MSEMQQDMRQHGPTPSSVVVLHGGPGGAGEIEPFAQELGRRGHAVLEPFQTERSVDGQVAQLRDQIERYCAPPAVVIGWSWGAWLGCLLAASHPALLRTLILVGSGPFDARYTGAIKTTKASRLTDEERVELAALRPQDGDPNQVHRFIELNDVSDTFARDASPIPQVRFDAAIHKAVWTEADAMRKSGALLQALSAIRCPVVALHGDYDPRPAEGVRLPLQAALPAATFTLLEHCGHKPWQEVHASAPFYRAVEAAIG
ncbi:alpha/beta hydrolase [uncultured Tateyamaria sp.]|uniref:alpha/beta fold hydrolase n=1 Tax=uncultured Tateyamaria sp. TaxID=455651 RepID=UPI0026270B00|nr:alpha/beta hydrolase [uncultured Tateyamaria sp.]